MLSEIRNTHKERRVSETLPFTIYDLLLIIVIDYLQHTLRTTSNERRVMETLPFTIYDLLLII